MLQRIKILVTSLIFIEIIYAGKLQWTTKNGQIVVNGTTLVIKGINYNGFESEDFAPEGLDERNLDSLLDFIKDNNFNAIRVPFSMEMIKFNPYVVNVCKFNQDLCEKTAVRLLDIFISRAAKRGLLIVLSNHRNGVGGYVSPPRWYDSDYSEETVIELWKELTNRYRNQWNVFAIDLKNDPHDVKWDNSDGRIDWKRGAERMIKSLADFPGLFFVQGIDWSNDFRDVERNPIDTGNETLNNRVVYSPHCYGPDNDPSNNNKRTAFDNNFKNLKKVYQERFGFLAINQSKPVVISEWGGNAEPNSPDEAFNDIFIPWLKSNCLTNNFYWSLTPNPHHIGGLLDNDWKTPVERKPNPTKFVAHDNGAISITKGYFPETTCHRDLFVLSHTKS